MKYLENYASNTMDFIGKSTRKIYNSGKKGLVTSVLGISLLASPIILSSCNENSGPYDNSTTEQGESVTSQPSYAITGFSETDLGEGYERPDALSEYISSNDSTSQLNYKSLSVNGLLNSQIFAERPTFDESGNFSIAPKIYKFMGTLDEILAGTSSTEVLYEFANSNVCGPQKNCAVTLTVTDKTTLASDTKQFGIIISASADSDSPYGNYSQLCSIGGENLWFSRW